ncbi:uncharacterized protein F4822DRAFT_432968 [Hypoxylon trugodes]|uniref:uncharacterized protein n=1 Tax=Hypoxylon trugodes TaxID=326681 RepID=UPI00218FADD2|nr:uncharacterized protein F4822DRAFT_432968 [Hypoxylon trugodes]KAI1384423.1 hypothetical protein F4822DRAFT_432968 [Hypoxylon trugodes]
MKFFRSLYLIPIAIRIAVVLAGRPGGVNGVGAGGNKGHAFGGSNHNGNAGAHGNGSPANKNVNNNGHGGNAGYGSIASHGQGQGNVQGSHGINSIVNAINSVDQQVHGVNLAIRSIRAGGNIDHLDSTLQSLTSTIRATSNRIAAAGSFNDGDIHSLKLAIQPFHQSIGTLVTQLVARRDTIARLCGCRAIQGAINHIRGSTRIMFDGIKNQVGHGRSFHGGKNGFNSLHSFDSGIASFLNHGYAAFGFANCIDVQAIPSSLSTYTTSTWTSSTMTAFTTVVVTNTVVKTVISTSWVSEYYSTYTSGYSSYTWTATTGNGPYSTRGNGYQGTNVPSDSSGFGYGGNGGSSNTHGHRNVDN